MLYDPGEHRPLAGDAWSEQLARDVIWRIAGDAIDQYRGPESLWPNVAEDLEGEADVPLRNAYFGAAGVAWAVDYLARRGLAPEFGAARELAQRMHHDFVLAPELTSYEPAPAPSLFFGESGILLAAEAILGDGSQLSMLEAAISRNLEHPSLELCWGSPGTMTAALALWRASGEERWRTAWMASAKRLLSEWRDLVWTQDLYGTRQQYVGAGHGFAGTAFALLDGRDLLGDRAEKLVERVREVLIELARVDGSLAQWFPLAGVSEGRHPVQWCHGSPGIVTSLAGLPHDPETDRLLQAGGELTWQAGPLSKGAGLCHGTAGWWAAVQGAHARAGEFCVLVGVR